MPPRVSSAELDAALARIHRRHDRIDDPRRSELGTEPRDVLAYLQRHSIRLSRAVATDDVADELVLHAWVWWEERHRERSLLRRARHLGVSLSELGAQLGLTTRQGMQDYLDRLDALLTTGLRDEQLTRAERRQARARLQEQPWIETYHQDIAAVIDRLLTEIDRILPAADSGHWDTDAADSEVDEPNDVLEWIDELRADRDDDALSPATLAVLGLVTGQLHVHPAVRALDPNHGLRRALRTANRLRSAAAERRAPPRVRR